MGNEYQVVKHVLTTGGTLREADQALRDYLTEKDCPRVSPMWRRRFVEDVRRSLISVGVLRDDNAGEKPTEASFDYAAQRSRGSAQDE